jgi:hypothetical protein
MSDVFFGIKTGYNNYFLLDKSTAKQWGIEKEFLKPVVTTPKKIHSLVVDSGDLNEYIFICHKTKNDLKNTNALKYIEYGEQLKVNIKQTATPMELPLPQVPSIKGRAVWYDLPEYDVPPIIFQELYDSETRALYNKARAHARAPLYYCIPNKGVDPEVIVAYLNTSIAQMLLELYGRSYGGGVLDVKVYELKELPCIDVDKLSKRERDMVINKFYKLEEAIRRANEIKLALNSVKSHSKKEAGLFESEYRRELESAKKEETDAQTELDNSFFDILGFSNLERKQILVGLSELQEIRKLRRDS